MAALIVTLSIPFMLLNMFGGIVGGVWLAFLGEWRVLVLGVAAMAIAPFVISILLMPGLIFGLPAAVLAQKGRTILSSPLILLSTTYTHAVVSVCCLTVLAFALDLGRGPKFWPMSLWGYSVAMAPWSYLARKDMQSGGGDASAATLFFAQIAYVITFVAIIAFHWPIESASLLFISVMLVSAVVQTLVAAALVKSSRY